MNILIFYFVSVFTSIKSGSVGPIFREKDKACHFGATLAAKHGGRDPNWNVIKVTIDLTGINIDDDEESFLMTEPVKCGNPS